MCDAGIDFNTIQGEGWQGCGGVTATRRLARGPRVLGLEGGCEEFKGALLNPSQELSVLFASLVVKVKYTYTKY